MNKKAKVGLVSFMVVLIFSALFIILILPLIKSDGEQDNWVVWSRTPSTETLKNLNTGEYQKILYSGARFIDDESHRNFPNYVPFNQVVNMSFDQSNGALVYSYKTEQREYNVTMKIGFVLNISQAVCSNQRWHWFDVGPGYCAMWATEAYSFMQEHGIGRDILITDNNYSFKYGINLTNIPSNYQDEIVFIGLRLEEVNGLTWDDVQLDAQNQRILIKNKIALGYDDLLADGFTLNLYDKKTVLIGNVSNKANLWLDPTVTLQDADTENLADSEVRNTNFDSSNETNYGTDNDFLTGRIYPYGVGDERYRIYRAYLQFDLVWLKANAVNYGEAFLYTYEGSGHTDYYNSVYHVYNWTNSTGSNILNETQITWNNQPCGINFDNSTNCNLTSEDTKISDGVGGINWIIYNINYSLSVEGGNNLSLALKSDTESTEIGDYRSFFSKESVYTSRRPYLNITYTPYIDIISPTPSQILTDDTPTANFNVSTAVNMTTCYWNNGTTNYTMTKLNNTYFYNNSVNAMTDGSHTITFWCNQTSDGTWRQSDSVSFDVDSVNVTVCRDLTVSRTYYLRNNVSSSTSCFHINETRENITFDGLGYVINGTGGDTGRGIYLEGDNIIIKNLTIYNFNGAMLVGGDNISIMNVNLNGYDDSIQIASSESVGGGNGTIRDSIVAPCTDISADGCIYFGLNRVYDFNFINVSYGDNNESHGTQSILRRKWYFEVQVNDSSGYLENAQVDIYDKDDNLEVSLLTNATGQIARQELIDYVNNAGLKTFNTPHTANISKTGYIINSTTYNLTEVNNVNHILTLDTPNAAPTSTLVTPTNNTYQASPVTFNCSATDGIGLKNITLYIWNGSTTTNTTDVSGTSNYTTFVHSLADGEYNWSCLVYDNHTTPLTDWANDNYTLTVDSTSPLIDFGAATETNNTNHSRDWIYANYTLTETNFQNITFNLYNSTHGLENSTNYSTLTYLINWTSLTDGVYYYNLTVYDKASNLNSTETRKITIDDTSPVIVISYPTDGNSYNNGTNFQINYTLSDNLIGLDSCWHTNDSGVTNYTLTCGNNLTHTFTDDTYTYVIYSNDTLNNIGSDSVTFTISSVAPSINLDYPTSNLWINDGTNVYFNFTATDINGLSTCELWGNWTTWHKNYTWIEPTNATQNYTQVNLSDGIYKYNVWCNDTLDNKGFSPSNFTFYIDETNPQVTNQSYSPTTVYNNLDVIIYGNITDTYLDTVWISINYTGSYQNITITEKIGNQYNYTLDSSYISNLENVSWRWWANDSAGNENSSDLEYFITTNRNPYSVNVTNPTNDSYTNANWIYINFTALDDDLDTLNYSLYYANASLSFALFNYTNSETYLNLTGFNITDGATNYFYVTANDSILQNTTSNYTFHIDLTNPTLVLDEPDASPTYQCSMSNIDLKYNANDTNIDYCEFNVTYGGLTSTAHTTISDCSNTTFNVIYDNSVQTLTFRAVDKAGNYNETTRLIYIDTDNSGCPSSPAATGSLSPLEPEDLGFCGDGVCNEERGESFYNCPEDCSKLGDIFDFKNFNLDKLFFNCIDGNEQTECFWKTNPAWFLIFILISVAFLFVILFEFKSGKTGMKKFVYTGPFKKNKRRR